MATKVMMEALSPTMEEGRLAKWLKAEGDVVANGDVLAEVETDKAIMELVARGAGVLRKRLIGDDTTAPVGQLIGVIAEADEDISAMLGGAGVAAPAPSASPAPAPAAEASPAPVVAAAVAATPAAPSASTAPAAAADDAGRVKASPLARRMASEQGVSLANVQGSGPGGRVIRRDIEAAASSPTPAPRATAPASAAAPAAAPAASRATAKPAAIPVAPAMDIDGDARDVPLTQMRKTIARRLAESIGPVPTFYLTAEIDMTAVTALREQMAASGDAFKVSVNDVIMKAVRWRSPSTPSATRTGSATPFATTRACTSAWPWPPTTG
jgi:pyruvate dehydrogenase E2 component (dihydrolipoamide acetyltransferase)